MNRATKNQKREAVAKLKQAYDNVDLSQRARVRIEHQLFDGPPPVLRISVYQYAAAATAAVVLVGLTFVLMRPQNDLPLQSSSLANNHYTAEIISVDGQGTLANETGTIVAKGAAGIVQNHTVGTSSKSRMEISVGPHRVRLDGDTKIRFSDLKKKHLNVQLLEGKAAFTVSPLRGNKRFRVVCDDLTVEVVGTVFSVHKEGLCSTVAVIEGTVKTSFLSQGDQIHMGEQRRYCSDTQDFPSSNPVKPGLSLDVLPSGMSPHIQERTEAPIPSTPKSDETEGSIVAARSQALDEPSAPPAPQNNPGVTSIEQSVEDSVTIADPSDVDADPGAALFDRAQGHLINGRHQQAKALFVQYIQQYPKGVLAQDAMYRVLRISFRTRRHDQVLKYGPSYLKRYGGTEYRDTEVRIFCASSLLTAHNDSTSALQFLSPLIGQMDRMLPKHKHQLIYLQFRSVCQMEQPSACTQWTERYLRQYPNGKFALMAKQYQKKFGTK